MKRLAYLSVLLLLPYLPGYPQDSADPAIAELSWNEFYTLQWDDFQGKPDKRSIGDAGTAVQIKAKPFLVKKSIHYDVVAIFSRKRSWVRDTSPSLLAHEQLHFDIAELYARKIRKKVRELSERGVDDIKVFNTAIHELLQESNDVDAQYDTETLHGALSKKQAAWSKKVRAELAQLNKYKKTKRVIGG
jgi:predicted secreted Zn-dependent protease